MKHFLFILSKIIFVPLGIVLSPLLYALKRPSKVWNINQDLPYDLPKPFWYIWGNMEDGVFFDPIVYKKLGKKFKRGSFRDFFEWNILRNPTHNLELLLGLDLKYIPSPKYKISEIVGYNPNLDLFINKNTLMIPKGTYKFISITKYFKKYKLEFYYGYRISTIRHIDTIDDAYVTKATILKFKEEGYQYLNNRGYPIARLSIALRFKKLKK